VRPLVLGAEMIAVSVDSAPPVTIAELEATKQCPFCAEPIKATAVVCRFCARDLEGSIETVPAIDEAPTCPHCGATAVGNMRHCRSCGENLVTSALVAAPAVPAGPVKNKIIRMRILLQLILVVSGGCRPCLYAASATRACATTRTFPYADPLAILNVWRRNYSFCRFGQFARPSCRPSLLLGAPGRADLVARIAAKSRRSDPLGAADQFRV
jgi:hypothetical protein